MPESTPETPAESQSQTIKVPNANAAPVTPPPVALPEFGTIVPPEFKDKPWVKETKDVPSLFKRMDSLLSEMGKKPAGIPQDTATQEEWDAFYKALGRPDNPEDYDFGTPPEGLPVNEGYQKEMRNILKAAGVPKNMAKKIVEGHNGIVAKLMKAEQETQNANFDKLRDQVFGQEADQAMKVSKALITKYTPESMKDHVANLKNEDLIVLASVIRGIQKDYISEDQIPDGGGGVGPLNEEQRREEGRKLMMTDAYTNPFHPEHDQTVKKVEALYNRK